MGWLRHRRLPPVLIFLGPMYGGAAILIRETARHLGAGWPTIVLLAAAFGVLQAGLVDQSLFNPDYLDDTQYADTRAAAEATLVPGLEFSLRQAFDYVGNHIVLTICAPIVLVESFLGPERRLRPWLGRPGLAVVGVIYLLGSLLIFSDSSGRKGFLASPLQLAFAAVLVVALVAVALLPRWRRARPRRIPSGAAPALGGSAGRPRPPRRRPDARLAGGGHRAGARRRRRRADRVLVVGRALGAAARARGWHGGPGHRRRVRVPGAAVLPGEPGGGPGRRHRGHRHHCRPGRRCLVAAALLRPLFTSPQADAPRQLSASVRVRPNGGSP